MMRKIIATIALMMINGVMTMAQGLNNDAPEWVYKIRMVSISHQRQGEPETEQLQIKVDGLKESGVNTIMAHGSLQFLPDLPDGTKQWQQQVNYQYALPFSQTVKGAGLKLFHHTTSTFVPIEAMDNSLYRQWASCDIRTGEPSMMPEGSYDDACFMDMNHPEFQELIFLRMAEYAENCQVDGWMTDEVEWLADIYAGGSETGSLPLYLGRFGKGYPTGNFDPNLPEWREYLTFRYDSGGDFYHNLQMKLREVNPEMQVSGCLAGISKYHRRLWAMGSENWLKGWNTGFFEMEEGFHPRGKLAGYMSTTYWPTYYREMALYNANGEANRWACSYSLGYPSTWGVENSEQFYLWAQSLSMGFRFWMRDYQAEPQWFAWDKEHEQDLVKPCPSNDIGIFFPEQSRDFATMPEIPYQNWSGISEALAWHNIPADQLVRAHFDNPEMLSRFKMIIVPSASFISDKMAIALRNFVSDGGILWAVGECINQDPFTINNSNDLMMSLLGVSEKMGWDDKSISFKYNNELFIYRGGMMLVKPLSTATVLAEIKDSGPTIIENRIGTGKVLFFTGRWGNYMHNLPNQKTEKYRETSNPGQRQTLAKMIKNELAGRMRVEARNLPAKVMFNVYDTDGDFDGKYKRTLHILDSFDGYEPGEIFPTANQPCRFKPFAERTEDGTLDFILRDLEIINKVTMISPDFQGEKNFEAVYSPEEKGYVISVPVNEFGRYSVIVVNMTPPTPVLKGYWKFGEGVGFVTEDSSGNNNHGSLLNTAWVDGIIGTGLVFDGINSLVDCGNDSSLKLSSTGAVTFWYKSNGWRTNVSTSLVARGDGAGWADQSTETWNVFNLNPVGAIAFTFGDGLGSYNWVSISPRPSIDVWHHYAFTFNGYELKAYLDGELMQSVLQTIGVMNQATLNTYMGKFRTPNGVLDEVKIYDQSLSADKIKDQAYCVSGRWDFEEIEGSITEDSSDNINDGILIGMPNNCLVKGKSGNALTLDGVSGYVDFGDNNSLVMNTEGTIEFWYKSNGWRTNVSTSLVARGDGAGWADQSTEAWNVFNYNPVGAIAFTIGNGLGSYNWVSISPRPSINVWHHYAFTFDGTKLNAYLDGTLAQTATQTVNVNPAAMHTYVGKFRTPNGIIDELRLYRKALTATEIDNHYKKY